MARPKLESVLAAMGNAGAKTVEALKHIIAEKRKTMGASSTENLSARERILALLDEGTFSEIGTYALRKNNEYDTEEGLESVICGWGSVNGYLVYVFSQDYSRSKGAVSEAHAKKICELYRLALENGAPVIGIFDSAGAMIPEGVRALSGYASVMSMVSKASGVIPQIALVPGLCAGTSSVICSMFDFVIVTEKTSSLSLNSPFVINCSEAGTSAFALETGLASQVSENDFALCKEARRLLSYLPSNNKIGTIFDFDSENPNRKLNENVFAPSGDIHSLLEAIGDSRSFYEIGKEYGSSFVTGFLALGGNVIGVIATNGAKDGGKMTIQATRKASKFLSFCDNFCIPILTVVDSVGPDVSKEAEKSTYAAELAKLSSLYASALVPMVTLIAGQAYGIAYTILGSKAIGADVVYAFESSNIGPMSADSAVAFLWNDQIDGETSREDLEKLWDKTCGSPATAAASGDIDDLIPVSDARIRIAGAFEMLSGKCKLGVRKRHVNMPL